MPKRHRETGAIRNFRAAILNAQAHPQHRLENVHPNTLTALAKRGLALPAPDGTGWRLSDAGTTYQPGKR